MTQLHPPDIRVDARNTHLQQVIQRGARRIDGQPELLDDVGNEGVTRVLHAHGGICQGAIKGRGRQVLQGSGRFVLDDQRVGAIRADRVEAAQPAQARGHPLPAHRHARLERVNRCLVCGQDGREGADGDGRRRHNRLQVFTGGRDRQRGGVLRGITRHLVEGNGYAVLAVGGGDTLERQLRPPRSQPAGVFGFGRGRPVRSAIISGVNPLLFR